MNFELVHDRLKIDALAVICDALKAPQTKIANVTALKKGMTNHSFLFTCRDKKYIMRIPGEGTDRMINRRAEAAVYQAIAGKHICDNIVYINPENGFKIAEFLDDARVCDPFSDEDLNCCMKKLREFHAMELTVEHEFDLYGQI